MARRRFSLKKDSRGVFVSKHFLGIDPELVGVKAYNSGVVREWWQWIRSSYKPRSGFFLVTPCSNVKPYTMSPTSRKIKKMLERLGLWNTEAPKVEWVYFSDLLILVPYYRAEEYPACCYDVPPQLVASRRDIIEKIVSETRLVIEALVDRGLEQVVVFLPKIHLSIWEEARESAIKWPSQVIVRYTFFSIRDLEVVVKKLASMFLS